MEVIDSVPNDHQRIVSTIVAVIDPANVRMTGQRHQFVEDEHYLRKTLPVEPVPDP